MKKFISVILSILVIGTFAFFALASGSDNASVSGEGSTAANSDKQTQELRIKVGESLNTDSIKLNYVSAETYKESNQYMQPQSGKEFYRLEFNVENPAESDLFISYFDFECYADGVACSSAMVSADDALSATLSKGRKATGAVYFEVPKDAQSIEVEYEYSIWNNSKAIFVVK